MAATKTTGCCHLPGDIISHVLQPTTDGMATNTNSLIVAGVNLSGAVTCSLALTRARFSIPIRVVDFFDRPICAAVCIFANNPRYSIRSLFIACCQFLIGRKNHFFV